MSAYDEERKSSSKSPIDDSSREGRVSNFSRPLTAKRPINDSFKAQNKSYIKFNPTKPKKILSKDRNSPMLSKLRPTKISVDKERLYIENMSLKVKLNCFTKVLTKYKARITHLEKALQKKEEASVVVNPGGSSCLVKLLKQNNKNLQNEVQMKNQEVLKLKQNMKVSKVAELELEVKAYMDECTRLRYYLEEALKDKEVLEENQPSENYLEINDDKSANLLKIIEENNKEIMKLKEKLKSDVTAKGAKTPKFLEEMGKLSKELKISKKDSEKREKAFLEEIELLKKEVKTSQKKITADRLKLEENNVLIANLYTELKSLRQKKKSKLSPPKLLRILNEVLTSQKISFDDFFKNLNPKNRSYIESKDLLLALKPHSSSITEDDLSVILPYTKSETASKISLKRLWDYFCTYSFQLEESPASKLSELFTHLSLRMQLHRIPKENLIEALLGAGLSPTKPIHFQEIVLLFTNSPFNFSRKQATAMVDYLFLNEKTKMYNEFIERFYSSIQDWEVFTASDEENFDNYLLELVSKYKDNIEAYCSQIDTDDKGTVSLKQFFSCLEGYKINITERIRDYLLVLFYSHNMELGLVPYRQFIQAYTNSDDNQSPEDEKTNIVQKYLEIISKSMNSSNRTVRSTFNYDENGLIVAEDFIEGIKQLNIEEIPKENLLVLLESLQYNPEERVVCIHVDELEEILESYGVQTENFTNVSEIISESEMLEDISEGHVQKISLLDSMQFDLSNLPEPGPRVSTAILKDNSF